MSDPPEDETPDEASVDFETILNRIATANRRTRRRTLVGTITPDEIMRNLTNLHESWPLAPYLNIVDLSSNIVIQPIDLSANEHNISSDIPMQPDVANTLNRLLQASFYDKAKYKKVLSSKGETELENLSYNIDLNTNSRCPIMHVDLQTEWI